MKWFFWLLLVCGFAFSVSEVQAGRLRRHARRHHVRHYRVRHVPTVHRHVRHYGPRRHRGVVYGGHAYPVYGYPRPAGGVLISAGGISIGVGF